MQNPKNIFITGATGFVGANLAYEFLKQGYYLKLLARDKNDVAEKRISKILSSFYGNQGLYENAKNKIEVIHGDITLENLGISSSVIERLVTEIGTVFHCAASTIFDEEKKAEIEKQNVIGTKNILEFAKKLKIPSLHYMSTAYVAGQRKGIVHEEDLDKGQFFNNPYEESKFAAEVLAREYQERYNIKTTIYRPAIIIGDSNSGKTFNFFGFYSLIRSLYSLIYLFKKDLERGGKRAKLAGVHYKGTLVHIPVRVGGIANKTLNLVPIDYVVDVIMKIFKNEINHNKTYHITNPSPPTLGHIQRLVCECLGVSGIRIVEASDFQSNPMNQWEEFFAKSIKNFAPYLQKEEPIFSNRNTQEVLNGTSICCPYITKNVVAKLIAYCKDTDWGRKNNESLFNTSISN